MTGQQQRWLSLYGGCPLRRLQQVLLMGLLCWLGLPGWAWSQKTQEAQTARRIYIEGARFLQQKRYEEASVQFRLAYRLLSKEYKQGNRSFAGALRKLRYFLGLCYFKMKKYDEAKKFLDRFLETETRRTGPRYLRAQKMRAEVVRQLALRPRPRPRPRPRREAKPPPRPRTIILEKGPPQIRWRATPFVVMGLGVAALIAGGVTAALTNGAVQERDDTYQKLLDVTETDPFSTPVAQAHHKAETLAITTNALFIGGGTLTGLGLILVFTVGREVSQPTIQKRVVSGQGRVLLLPEVR